MQKTPNPEASVEESLQQITIQKAALAQREYEAIEKGLSSNNPIDIVKANSYWEDVQNRESSGVKTTLVDPNEWTQGQGYKHKRFHLDYSTQRRMVSTTPIIKAIIGTRQAQVSAFSSPQSNKYETGFVIRKKREFYTEEEPTVTAKDKEMIKNITKFLLNGGEQENAWNGDTFDSFLKKIAADSLVLDQACFEIVRNNKGIPVEYLAVDGATIRMADTLHDDDKTFNEKIDHQGLPRKKIKGYLPSYVQVIGGQIQVEYYPWELCFGVRNTTTDIRSNGYGKSEIEELISVITWMLYGDAYNGKFFSQGSNPKGMLKVGSGVNRNRLAEFRQQWLAMVAGISNAWKVPMVEGDVEWIDMQKGNKDMEFSNWQEYLIKVACAVFKMAPEEIGFTMDKGGGLNASSDNETKLSYSKDKGLKPLLKSIEFWINKWLIGGIDDNFEFKFVGLNADDEKMELDLLNLKVQHGMGMREWREAIGLPKELEEGDFPLNSVYAQISSQQQQAEMMGDQSEDNGQYVDDGEAQSNIWDMIDDDPDVEKSMVSESDMYKLYADNPMMRSAMDMLMK
jgi:hypothetical protein